MLLFRRFGFAVFLGLLGCHVTDHPAHPAALPRPEPTNWEAVLARPSQVEVEVITSAKWAVPRKGVINLKHPTAKAAGLRNEPVPIVLPVGIVRHPTRGDFIIDTGIDRSFLTEDPVAVRGLIRSFLKELEPVEPLGDAVARRELHLAGVLLTHMHVDHVLGLPDLPKEVPIYVGPGETEDRKAEYGLLRPTYRRLLEGHDPLREFEVSAGIAIDPFPVAIDLLSDGTLWALPSPGHTAGSMAYLVIAKDGPVLFVGDTSHTRWGWEHDVEPGTYTADHPANAESLARLRRFAELHPQTRVILGHTP